MEHPATLSEKQKMVLVITESDVPSLNRYRPKIVVTPGEPKAATEEDVGNAGEFFFVHALLFVRRGLEKDCSFHMLCFDIAFHVDVGVYLLRSLM
jgi:hypothetical protein